MQIFFEKIFKKRFFELFITLIFPFFVAIIFAIEANSFLGGGFLLEDVSYYAKLHSTTDMAAYIEEGLRISKGEFKREPFYRAPLYGIFLAFLFLFSQKIWIIVFFHCIFYALTAKLIFLTCKNIFDITAGYFAVMLFLLGGFLTYWVVIPHTAVMEMFLCILSFYFIERIYCDFRTKDIVSGGISGGLLCLVRPNFLLVVPIVLSVIFGVAWYCRGKEKKIIFKFLLSIIAFVGTLFPFILWNNMHSDSFVLISTNAASTWRMANSRDSIVENFKYPKEPLMKVNSAEFWIHQWRKLLAFCKDKEVPQNESFYYFKYFSILLDFQFASFGIFISLFIGSIVFYSCRLKNLLPFYLFIFLYVGTVVMFFIIGRFRVTVVPCMAVFSGAFLKDIMRELKNKKISESKSIFALILVLFFYIFSEPWVDADVLHYWKDAGRIAFARGDMVGYRDCMRRFIELSLKDGISNKKDDLYEYAVASGFAGDFEEASKILDEIKIKWGIDNYLVRSFSELELLRGGQNTEFNNLIFTEKDNGAFVEYAKRKMALDILLKSEMKD